jgi:hypothetical protein
MHSSLEVAPLIGAPLLDPMAKSGLTLALGIIKSQRNLELQSFPVGYDVDLAVVPLLFRAISDASGRRHISRLPGTTVYLARDEIFPHARVSSHCRCVLGIPRCTDGNVALCTIDSQRTQELSSVTDRDPPVRYMVLAEAEPTSGKRKHLHACQCCNASDGKQQMHRLGA